LVEGYHASDVDEGDKAADCDGEDYGVEGDVPSGGNLDGGVE